MPTLSIELDQLLEQQLDALAKATDQPKSVIASYAVKSFIDINQQQITEIEKALKEAEQQDLAGQQQVAEVLRKWR